MQTKTKIKAEKKAIRLKLIKGGLHPSAKKEKRIHDFWKFCHAAFWPNENFSEVEQQEFKRMIASHFADCGHKVNTRFRELIERAALAQRLKREEGIYIGKPVQWLSSHFSYGLNRTSGWTDELRERRELVPGYCEDTALLAAAVLNFCRCGQRSDVAAYRNRFIALRKNETLALYLRAVTFLQFTI